MGMKLRKNSAITKIHKIAILYYCGVGNTKMVAEAMYDYLKNDNNVDMYSIEELPADFNFVKYSKLIMGFPTIHAEPSSPMKRFIEQLDVNKNKLPTFIYTTCGWYSGNAIRIFCKLAIIKNIIPVYTSSYQCAAVDGILLTPNIKRWYKHEKELFPRIKNDLDQFLVINEICSKIPRLKWYSALNYPNKLLGKHMKFKIYLRENKCTKCDLCVRQCPVGACIKGDNNVPFIDTRKCINCYRCIHHCHKRALSLSKRKSLKKTLVDLAGRKS